MNLRSKEISSVIREQIKNYNVDLVMEDVGTVIEVGDGIARIFGLQNAKAGELIEFPGGIYGLSLIHISEPTRQCCTSRMPSSA